jgi:hypothetical protein
MLSAQSGAKPATLVASNTLTRRRVNVYDHKEFALQTSRQCREGSSKAMPVQIRKLSSDEAAKVFPKRGQMDLSEYTDALRELQPGDAAEIELGPLSSRALKRRLGQAAKQTGYSLKWARDGGTGVLRFQVREVRGTTAKPRNGRRGRRRRAE